MIFFVGDLQLSGDPDRIRQQLIECVEEHKPDAVILLGDMTTLDPLDNVFREFMDKLWFIPGNHDSDRPVYWENISTPALAGRNLHGRVVDIAGHRIAGLGGVFRAKIWHPPEHPSYNSFDAYARAMKIKRPPRLRDATMTLEMRHNTTIFPDVVKTLSSQRAEILVTHEAPSCYPKIGWPVFDQLAAAMGVSRIFHGHHHEDYANSIAPGGQSIAVTGVGLCGIVDEAGRMIFAGQEGRRE